MNFRLVRPTNHINEEERVGRVENDLKNRIDDDENSAVFSVASGEVVPYIHHRNTARQADLK